MPELTPSLYELLLQNFAGELDLHQVAEEDQLTLSVLDNLQRILNSLAGTLSHLPDYGLPDMSLILFNGHTVSGGDWYVADQGSSSRSITLASGAPMRVVNW